jgi:uncharacterized membrane protein YhaH (DUF805 family)
MDFWGAIKSGFANYVTFSGRANQSEFWYWILFTVLGTIATSLIDAVMFPQMVWFPRMAWPSPLNSAFQLLTFLPSLAVAVRRVHDHDARGWWGF